jgi:hypothetical protein
MNQRAVILVLFFAMLLISPRLVEPAYNGFLVAFALLIGFQLHWHGVPTRVGFKPCVFSVAFVCVVVIALAVILDKGPAPRDLLRDLGALTAFFVGRQMFVAYRDKGLQRETLLALSAMGVLVSIVTIGAALSAWHAGVSAYIWRGEYVPWAHTWLPYALVANVFLVSIDSGHAGRYIGLAILCAVGTIASLSRTDLLLELGFGLALMYKFRRELFLYVTGFAKLVITVVAFAAVVLLMLRLPVVQQRVEAGVGDADQSLGWRFMEHVALLHHFLKGTVYDALFGFGLGARMPLPPGIVDFNNNTSIPQLHNSFGTIALKFGVMGLLFLGWYLVRIMRQSFALRCLPGEPYRQAGRWIVLLCLGKALTLQGLNEWSHVVFFGIGCMLLLNRPRSVYRIVESEAQTGATSEPFASARWR